MTTLPGKGLVLPDTLGLSLSTEPSPVPPIPNEQQLARLTDYVAFLEN